MFKCGKDNPTWNGGRYINTQGYVLIRSLDHPNRDCRGYVREHILVMEKALGRLITPSEIIHHIDEDRTNNNIGNLMLFKTKAMHIAYHSRLKAFQTCGHYDWLPCSYCHKYDSPENMVTRSYKNKSYPDMTTARHKECASIYLKGYRERKRKVPTFSQEELAELMA